MIDTANTDAVKREAERRRQLRAQGVYRFDLVTRSDAEEKIIGLDVVLTREPAKRRRRDWTEEEETTLRRWYESHVGRALDMDALCQALGRNRNAVSTKARALGLTDQSRPRPEAERPVLAARARAQIAENGHPRGMLGKRHSAATRARLSAQRAGRAPNLSDAERQARSDRLTLRHATDPSLATANCYSRARRGRRADLGDRYFRSAWEANYARFLEWQRERGVIAAWEYEPETFWFEAIRRGVRSYLPDFRVTENDGRQHYVEVKGWMDARSKTKLARMAKYHPHIDIRVVDADAYREIARKVGAAIPGWEVVR